MKKGWTTTKLIAIGGLVVIKLLVRIFLYTPLLVTTGSVFAGLSIMIISPFFKVLTALIINQVGAVTLFYTLCLFVELPMPMIWPTIVNLIYYPLAGLGVDVIYLFLKDKKRLFSFVAGFICNFVDAIITILLYFTVGIFGTKGLPGFFTLPIVIVVVAFLISIMGGFSGYLAYLTYGKIKNTSVIKRIQR